MPSIIRNSINFITSNHFQVVRAKMRDKNGQLYDIALAYNTKTRKRKFYIGHDYKRSPYEVVSDYIDIYVKLFYQHKNYSWEPKGHLHPDNCNKAKCKTCIFGETPLTLSLERMEEIKQYLLRGQASHICHITDKTCYGALEYQAKAFYQFGFIPEPTVESLLQTAREALGIAHK